MRETADRTAKAIWLILLGFITLNQLSVASAQDKKKVPKVKIETLKTKDGVTLVCDYYPGTNGKETVPIVMVHGWGGVRGEFKNLALAMQSKFGHAVIVPDLRGHGDSVRRTTERGDEKTINPKRMNRRQLAGMYEYDLAAVRNYLVDRNDDGELNIRWLTLVGADMGAIVAMNWAVRDWSWQPLTTGKQGQDVQAFVLISPMQAFKGLKIQPALEDTEVRKLSTMILVGSEDRKTYSQARRLNTNLKRFHPPVPSDPQEAERKQSLFFVSFDTSLKGTKLLDASVDHQGLSPHDCVGRFIELRLLNKKDKDKWQSRSNPLSG